MGSKKKKGNKAKVKTEVNEAVTTRQIVKERERSLCPRLGDGYLRSERADTILMECVLFKIQRTAKNRGNRLDISRSKLRKVPEEMQALLGGDELKEIDLSKNALFNSEDVFEALTDHFIELQKLNLGDNFLNGALSPRVGSIASSRLDTLILDNNQITALPENLSNLRHMKYFSVANNALVSLPSTLGAWTQLEYLNARGNKLLELPDSIMSDAGKKSWTRVHTLYLANNQFISIPDEIHHLISLTALDLSANKLTKIPIALASCSQLKQLHLGNNAISNIPAEILASLTHLEELHLYKNSKLDSLPPEIGSLTNCKRLTLSSTNLKTLPDSIQHCQNLSELYINNCNKFVSLPSTTASLSNLKEIQAKKCPGLKSIPNGGWSALQDLDLRAAKKQVCKISPQLLASLESHHCIIRGGVTSKAKGKGKK